MDVASISGGSNSSKISKLLPKKLTARRRIKNHASGESLDSTASSEDGARGRSPRGRNVRSGTHGSFSTSHGSEPSLIEDDGEDGDGDETEAAVSPFDYAADDDVSHPRSTTRPTVPSSHPSQIGHLTTSSPFIQNHHLSDIQALDHGDSPRGAHLSKDQPELSLPTLALEPPPKEPRQRSKSPAGRFRDAFRSKKASGSNTDGDVAPSLENSPSTIPVSAAKTHRTPDRNVDDPVTTSAKKPLRPFRPHPLIDTSAPPRTPPQSEKITPEIVNTPPTPTDSTPSSVQDSPVSSRQSPSPNVVVSPSGNMISHRRARASSSTSLRSIGPSKLSNITAAPLTPTPENVAPSTPSFFSSVFSAAQNAANTLSNTINTGYSPGVSKSRPGSSAKASEEVDDDRVEVVSSAEHSRSISMGGKELAVKTLGSGGLSLEQLGIGDSGSASPTPTAAKFSEKKADSRLRSESAPVDVSSDHHSNNQLEESSLVPSGSTNETSSVTPPASVYEGKTSVQRSGSIRSAISRRRKRGSTGGTATTSGTATTIGAAIAAANASISNPQASGGAHKFTGFAVASKKRNRDFHGLFKSVPDDDYLIEDYSCALQREILAHGRLYVSEGHLCFSSNILGWSTTLVLSFDEIVSVEKRSTALVFKNGLMISTLHAKHIFASFTSRDSTYDLIVNIWKLGHPTLRSTLNGVSLGDETGGDKTEKVDVEAVIAEVNSGSATDDEDDGSDDGEEIYDEDEDEDEVPQTTQITEPSSAETDPEKNNSKKVSGAATGGGDKAEGAPAPSTAANFPGPATHVPTNCTEADSHFDVALADDTIPAPLGQIYDLMFGPKSVTWMANWLTGEQKCTELQMEDKKGLTSDNKTRHYTYIKPLYASIGPKQTKCIVDETVEALDLEKSVSVLVAVQNPDVPSGNVFSVKTKYCLTWADNNSTRVNVNCTIEWTGKSWLKGPIEKGAKEGQTQYCKDIFAALKAAVSSRGKNAAGNGASAKGKKKKGKGRQTDASQDNQKASDRQASKASDWGVFEPLHGVLGPVGNIIKPVFTGNVVYGLFVGLLVASFFGFGIRPAGPGYSRSLGFMGHAERAIAYDEAWRNEEGDLWDWLEDRVGHHRLSSDALPVQKRPAESHGIEEKLREERMNEREVAEAIRVTEEKLKILKSVMDQRDKVKAPA